MLAKALRRELLRVDLSRLVSRYIGETEKNLRRVFDAAETGGSVLLLDEADAFFGARTEVRDAHDRYLTDEINYLFQRIESGGCLAILSTAAALPSAWRRKVRFAVHFD